MAKPEFRAEGVALHGHPFVVQRAVAGHVPHKANILPLDPCPRIINKILILLLLLDRMLQRNLNAFHFTLADHVGLAQQDEDLNRFGHVGRFVVRLRYWRFCRRDGGKSRKGESRDRDRRLSKRSACVAVLFHIYSLFALTFVLWLPLKIHDCTVLPWKSRKVFRKLSSKCVAVVPSCQPRARLPMDEVRSNLVVNLLYSLCGLGEGSQECN